MNEFDFNKPFTMSELVEFYQLGNAHDPRISRPLVTELVAKGYSLRIKGRRRVWAKWPEIKPFVMPAIP
jgi:hypothetical protein